MAGRKRTTAKAVPLTVAEFLREALARLIPRLTAAAQAVPAVEAVHDLRVATRRLRALLSMFREFLPPGADAARARLRKLAAGFSELRDLDVLLINLRQWRAGLAQADNAALEPILARLAADRSKWVNVASAALAEWQAGGHSALERLASFKAPWPARSRQSVTTAAKAQVDSAHGKFRKALEHARREVNIEAYHALRLRAKKLRYVLDAMAKVLGKPAGKLLRDLEDLQDHFGAWLDASLAAQVMGRLPGRTAARMADLCRKKAEDRLLEMPKLLKRFQPRRRKRVLQGRRKRGRA